MFRRTCAAFSLLALFCAFFTFSGNAFAATSPTPVASSDFSVQLATLHKTCRIVAIHLDGAKHAAACIQAHSEGSAQPNTGQGPCPLSDFVIWNYDYTGELCFWGSGYLGVAIYDVNAVENDASDWSWYRYYPPGAPGVFQNIVSGGGYIDYGWGNTGKITQICDSCGPY